MYIHDTTQVQATYQVIKNDNPNTSFPPNGTATLMDVWFFVNLTDKPTYDTDTETTEEGTPLKTADVYNQTWSVVPLTQEVMDANLSTVQSRKEVEIDRYADNLIAEAYANPTQTLGTVDGVRYKKKVNTRMGNNAASVAGEIALSQADKDQSKTDQKLSEHEVKLGDDADKSITNMLKLDTPSEVKAFDISAETWTPWSPPV